MDADRIINAIRMKYHFFEGDYEVKKAIELDRFMDTFPEDYADGDYDAEDLYDQLCTFRYAFLSLLDLFE